jgi:hypothetical protein
MHRREDNIQIVLTNGVGGCGLNLSGSVCGPLAGCREHDFHAFKNSSRNAAESCFANSPLLLEFLVLVVNGYSVGRFHVKMCAKCTLHSCYRQIFANYETYCRLLRRTTLTLTEDRSDRKLSQLAHTKTDRSSAQCFLDGNTMGFSRSLLPSDVCLVSGSQG